MEFLVSLHDALPWYLQLTGSSRLYELLAEWGANHGIVRGDDWTLVFLWIYKWLAIGAVVWGVVAGLLVLKRSPKGRFHGDPEKYRDALVTGVLRAAAGAALAAVIVLVLFLAAAVGPGPLLWIGFAYLVARQGRRLLRSRAQKRAASSAVQPGRKTRREKAVI
jgi:hypothetical protein